MLGWAEANDVGVAMTDEVIRRLAKDVALERETSLWPSLVLWTICRSTPVSTIWARLAS